MCGDGKVTCVPVNGSKARSGHVLCPSGVMLWGVTAAQPCAAAVLA